jgi:hypothetical protein
MLPAFGHHHSTQHCEGALVAAPRIGGGSPERLPVRGGRKGENATGLPQVQGNPSLRAEGAVLPLQRSQTRQTRGVQRGRAGGGLRARYLSIALVAVARSVASLFVFSLDSQIFAVAAVGVAFNRLLLGHLRPLDKGALILGKIVM